MKIVTENIRDIFDQNIVLLGDLDKVVTYFRKQEFEKGLGLIADTIDRVRSVIEAIIAEHDYFNLVSTEALLEMLKGLLEAKKNRDFILLADLLELQLINFLTGVQELIISKDEILFNEDNYKENIDLLLNHGEGFPEELLDPVDTAKLLECGYRVEFTSCGQMTLAADNEGQKFYFHTNSKVKSEAAALAGHWYHKATRNYILYGFGMGYHVTELLKLHDSASIEVYEADRNVVQLACAFAEVKELLVSDRVKLIYDPDFSKLKERIQLLKPEETFLLHYPSYRNVRMPEGRVLLAGAFPWAKAVEDF